ncbi:hypothetical protein [Cupriavidus necator]|nr:hypothetical protein [Cupriavidus necator]
MQIGRKRALTAAQVSVATIRTQVKSIYAKTNMQWHGDLVRLVLSL